MIRQYFKVMFPNAKQKPEEEETEQAEIILMSLRQKLQQYPC